MDRDELANGGAVRVGAARAPGVLPGRLVGRGPVAVSEMVTIREACAATGLPRQRLFQLLLRRELGYRQVEPDGPYLVDRDEVAAVQQRGLAWARGWGERWEALHPDGSRIDRLQDWAE